MKVTVADLTLVLVSGLVPVVVFLIVSVSVRLGSTSFGAIAAEL